MKRQASAGQLKVEIHLTNISLGNMAVEVIKSPEPKPNIGSNSVNLRRPHTSYSEHQFAPSPRITSARHKSEPVTMPRSHVSIARFYDWSEDLGECVSISKFYRDLSLPRNSDKIKGKDKQWCANGIHINPGRMFLRDKNGLTKGEREIIEGIYKNRGDLLREDSGRNTQEDINVVKSHKEAWLVGKHVPKSGFKFDSPCDLKLPDYLFSKSVEPPDPVSRLSSHDSNENKDSPSTSRNGINDKLVLTSITPSKNEKVDILFMKEREVPKAPPSSPKESPRMKNFDNLNSHPKIPPINNGHGTILVERGEKPPSIVRENQKLNKKRLFVNVFLPKTSSDISRENSFLFTENNKHAMFTDDEEELYRARIDNMRFSRHRKDLMASSLDVHRSFSQKSPTKSDNFY